MSTPNIEENITQYGFYFDQSRCTGCNTCVLACKSWKLISPGPVKLIRLQEWEEGAFPKVRVNMVVIPCFHCKNPVCLTASKTGALYKESKYGAVLLDPEKASLARDAAAACPYGAIVFESDDPNAPAFKCDMCIDRLEAELKPACVMSCQTRALAFDTLENLQKKYGTNSDLSGLPSSSITTPSVVFKAKAAKKSIVTYPSDKAVTLLAKRDPLPALFSSASDLTDLSAVGRSKLVIKPKNVEDFVAQTINDDG
jgi:anaerobic dimethyl sulfoxide reductase subunit B (iron-sulfur subunit)